MQKQFKLKTGLLKIDDSIFIETEKNLTFFKIKFIRTFLGIIYALFFVNNLVAQSQITNSKLNEYITPDSLEVFRKGSRIKIINSAEAYVESTYKQVYIFNGEMASKKLDTKVVQINDSTFIHELKFDSTIVEIACVSNGVLNGLHVQYFIDWDKRYNQNQLLRLDTYFNNGLRDGTRIFYDRNKYSNEWQVYSILFYEKGEEVFYSINLRGGDIDGIFYAKNDRISGWWRYRHRSGYVMEKYRKGKIKKTKIFQEGKLYQHNNLRSGFRFNLIKLFGKRNFPNTITPYFDDDGNIIWY